MIRFLPVAALACAYHDLRRQVREEATNDGPVVRHMLRNAGINVAAPWCAAWIQDITDSAAASLGLPNPLDAVKLEALVDSYAQWAEEDPNERIVLFPSRALPGDLVIFNFGGKRWDHIGILATPPASDITGSPFETIEGNTNEAGGREGDGVYRKKRNVFPTRQLFVRWS